MKRIRRISLEIEHRELFISITRSVGDQPADFVEFVIPSAPVTPVPEPDKVCPVCGSPWLVLSTVSSKPLHHEATLQALLACGLHVYLSPSGELWACRQSFQQIKFQETKEKP